MAFNFFNALLKSISIFCNFWCKNVPCMRYLHGYLQKKIYVTPRDFQKALMDIYGIHELPCDINVCDKNSLASIFKWLVAWKQDLPRPKFSYENLSPSATLSYTVTKKWKSFFIEGFEATKGPHFDRVLFRFHSDSVLFMFLSDRVLFRSPSWVHSDRLFFRVLNDRSFFCPACRYFFIKTCFLVLKTGFLCYIIFSKRSSHLN